MALGDLSPDQARYAELVAGATGLARDVVVAWVGTESGWGRNMAGHNYLNIGPGRTYQSTAQAAAAAAALVNASDRYVGIRAAIPAGGGAQIQAIGASPWGTSASLLNSVYQQIIGRAPAVATAAAAGAPPQAQTVGLWEDAFDAFRGGLGFIPPPAGIPDPVGAGVKKIFGFSVVEDLVGAAGKIGLGLIFTVAAFAFIAMGLNRLTGAQPKGIFNELSGIAGAVGGAAKLAV